MTSKRSTLAIQIEVFMYREEGSTSLIGIPKLNVEYIPITLLMLFLFLKDFL